MPGSNLMRLACWETLSSHSMEKEKEGYTGDVKTSDEDTVVIQGRKKDGDMGRERPIKVGEITVSCGSKVQSDVIKGF